MDSIEIIAKNYAVECHRSTNHLYDDGPYEVHLTHVSSIAKRPQFLELIPETDREMVVAACWAHDTIEDTRQTYNDVKKVLGLDVAEIVYALTNEKGRTRKDRASAVYYEGIRNTPYAVFVKLCDRIANVEHSKSKGSRMFEVYGRETPDFIDSIYDAKYELMFAYLRSIFL
jgi:(p)ppGpp synthase/HD superfamily hydrolase